MNLQNQAAATNGSEIDRDRGSALKMWQSLYGGLPMRQHVKMTASQICLARRSRGSSQRRFPSPNIGQFTP
jgi:hypothetical protein